MVSEQELIRHLRGSLGQPLAVYDVVDSTNNAAKLLAKSGAPHGSLLVARQQTAGRGRMERSFFSPRDAGVYFTIILRPLYSPERLALTTAAASVAVVRAIRKVCGINAQIKWVNDIYLNGKKICGILAESSIGAKGLEYIVLGIGINISPSAYPPELASIVTSLESAGAGCADANILVAEVLYQFEDCMESGDFLQEYSRDSCVLGKEIRVIGAAGEYPAMAECFDEQAHLCVRLKSGETKVLCSGEISIRGDFTEK